MSLFVAVFVFVGEDKSLPLDEFFLHICVYLCMTDFLYCLAFSHISNYVIIVCNTANMFNRVQRVVYDNDLARQSLFLFNPTFLALLSLFLFHPSLSHPTFLLPSTQWLYLSFRPLLCLTSIQALLTFRNQESPMASLVHRAEAIVLQPRQFKARSFNSRLFFSPIDVPSLRIVQRNVSLGLHLFLQQEIICFIILILVLQ